MALGAPRVLGVIPARGGSKGIPRKNLYPLCGKPLIAYSIIAALGARRVTRLVVSTEDPEIAEVARGFGAEVPFLRPRELATDEALSVDVVKHALLSLERAEGVRYDYVVLLQPTTPLRTAADIDGALEKLERTACDSVISMVDVGANHPARMYRIVNDRIASVMDEGIAMRPRQQLPPIYIRSGDVYACRRDVVLEQHSMMGKDVRPFLIPAIRAVNIDSKVDLVVAEHLLEMAGEGNPGP